MKAVASFIYTDKNGKAVARIDRIESKRNGKKKDFLPYLASDAGFAQKPGLDGATLQLYHLPDVLRVARDNGTIFFGEGEGKSDKLRDALKKAEITAAVTTVFGGANGRFQEQHVSAFAGAKSVVVIADSDEPGRRAAKIRAQAIADALPQTTVKAIDLFPELDDGSDAVQWLEAHDIRELADLVKSAPIIKPQAIPSDSDAASLVPSTPTGGTNTHVRSTAADLVMNARNGKQKEISEQDWPTLQELPEVKLTAPTLPPEYVPEPIRDWVIDCARRHNVHPEAVLGSYLSAAAAVIGNRCVVIPDRSNPLWQVRIDTLWSLNIGKPSSLKTSVFGEAVAPLHHLEKQAHKQHEIEMLEYSKRHQSLKDEIKALESTAHAKSGGDARKSLAEKREELRELERNIPIRRRYVVDDATPEALVEILRENPRGVLIAQDEIKGLVDTFSRKGREGERQLYLKAWNHFGPHTVDRIGRGNKFIPSLGFCLAGASQPSKIRPVFDEAKDEGGDGFIARFHCIAFPDGQPDYQRDDRAPNYEAKNLAYKIIEYLDTFNPLDIGATKQVTDEDICAIHFDDTAQEVFYRWRADLEKKLRTDPEILGSPGYESALGKYRSFLPALAGIVCLLDVAAAALLNDRCNAPINAAQVSRAAFLAEFYRQHLLKAYGIGLMTPGRRLAALIKRGQINDNDKLRDIARHEWTDLKTPDAIKSAFKEIESNNICRIEERKPKGRGRAAVVLRVHPDYRKDNSGTVAEATDG